MWVQMVIASTLIHTERVCGILERLDETVDLEFELLISGVLVVRNPTKFVVAIHLYLCCRHFRFAVTRFGQNGKLMRPIGVAKALRNCAD